MATNPESIEREQTTVVTRVIEVAQSLTSRNNRERTIYALAAACGSLAPEPFGALAAALLALAALERR